MKLRQSPYWLDRVPPRRRPSFPRLRTSLQTRVVIVGGGLTGVACAWSLSAARIPVILLERDHVGGAATAGTVGLVREEFDGLFGETVRQHGLRSARALWQMMRRASLEFPAALRRLGARVELAPRPLLDIAPADREAAALIRRDYDARRAAGLDQRWLTSLNLRRETRVEGMGAIKTAASVLNPYRACVAMLEAAVSKGADVYERSEVLRIRARARSVEVTTAAGMVSAESVIVAGGGTIRDLRQLQRHLRPRHAYGVVTAQLPGAVKRELGNRSTTLRLGGEHPKFVRWLSDDRALVAGADQDPIPPRSREEAVTQRSGQLMYELSLLFPAISGTPAEWGWWLPFDDTIDGLPYIGPHRRYARQLFALGYGGNGMTFGFLASRLLLEWYRGNRTKDHDLFAFSR